MRCAMCGLDNPKEAVFCRHCGRNLIWGWRIRGAIGSVVGFALMMTITVTLGQALVGKFEPTTKGIIAAAIAFAFVFLIGGGVGGAVIGAFLNKQRDTLRAAVGAAIGFTVGGGAFVGVIGDAYWYSIVHEIESIDEISFVVETAIVGMFLGLFLSKDRNAFTRVIGTVVSFLLGGLFGLAIVNWVDPKIMDQIISIIGKVLGAAILLGIGGGIGGAFLGAFLYGRVGALKGAMGATIGFAIGGAISMCSEGTILLLIGFVIGSAVLGAFIGEIAMRYTMKETT